MVAFFSSNPCAKINDVSYIITEDVATTLLNCEIHRESTTPNLVSIREMCSWIFNIHLLTGCIEIAVTLLDIEYIISL